MPSIRRISVTDFLSHKKSVLELDPHYNVFTGPTNSGKSAIIRAIGLLYGGSKLIPVAWERLRRYGAKELNIVVEMDTGHSVGYRRSSTCHEYWIVKYDEEQHFPIKQHPFQPPREVLDVLGLPESDVARQIVFAAQGAPDLMGGSIDVSKRLGELFGDEFLDELLANISTDLKRSENDLTKLKVRLDGQEELFALYDEFSATFATSDEYFKRLDLWRDASDERVAMRRCVAALSEDARVIETLQAAITDLQDALDATLPALELLSSAVAIAPKLKPIDSIQIKRAQSSIASAISVAEALRGAQERLIQATQVARDLHASASQRERLIQMKQEAEADIEQTKARVSELLQDISVCPTCGSVIDASVRESLLASVQ